MRRLFSIPNRSKETRVQLFRNIFTAYMENGVKKKKIVLRNYVENFRREFDVFLPTPSANFGHARHRTKLFKHAYNPKNIDRESYNFFKKSVRTSSRSSFQKKKK